MDVDDINREIEGIKLPRRQPGKVANFNVKYAGVKVALIRFLALLLLAIIAVFSVLVVLHFKGDASMSRVALVIIAYMAMGGLLAYKLWKITYIGWLFSFLLSLAGVFLSALTFVNKGFMAGILAVMAISIMSAIALWWVKDLFGIKSYRDIFKPF
jgi:magnesium-transporting ATPase (P-type)